MAADKDILGGPSATILFRLCVGIYFIGGFTNSLVGLLVPRLRLLLGLDHTRSLLVQLAFHASYLLFAIPITSVLVRIGYMRAIALGLALMAVSGLALALAILTTAFSAVLLTLLTLSAGITFLQIAGNIVVPVVEPSSKAVSRMTLLQGFNSVGTVVAPLIGARFLLQQRHDHIGFDSAIVPFALTSLVTAALAWAFLVHRNLLRKLPRPQMVSTRRVFGMLADRRLLGGATAIFCYVGAEVTIGTLLVEYLTLPTTLGLSVVPAGQLVSLYWGGAMIGRFAGARVLAGRSAAKVLLVCASTAALLVVLSVVWAGPIGAVALVAVGLCNAAMYPTIFALSLPDDQSTAPYASMVLCMVVVGGAVIPLATGVFADRAGLRASLLLPGACYLIIGLFAWLRQSTNKRTQRGTA